jgi:membrane complex biogenesis BtpA family protein
MPDQEAVGLNRSGKQGGLHQELWGEKKPVVGMVHLLPLPGSPGYGGSVDEVLSRASEDAKHLFEGGLDGILVENYGDTPFFPDQVPPETVAAMAVVARRVVRATPLPVGVNVLRNDAEAALAVAVAAGARFIRVNVHTGTMFTDQGELQGKAFHTLRQRTALDASVAILADVFVKHATPPPGLTPPMAARDTWFRGRADGLVLTGTETGASADLEAVQEAKAALPEEARVWVGSGANRHNAHSLLAASDGLIVGSSLQAGGVAGGGVEPHRVRAFMEALTGG